MTSTVTGMTGMCHHPQMFSVEIGTLKLFCLGWPVILPTSASCVDWDDKCVPLHLDIG
jgi:hypothetical protein